MQLHSRVERETKNVTRERERERERETKNITTTKAWTFCHGPSGRFVPGMNPTNPSDTWDKPDIFLCNWGERAILSQGRCQLVPMIGPIYPSESGLSSTPSRPKRLCLLVLLCPNLPQKNTTMTNGCPENPCPPNLGGGDPPPNLGGESWKNTCFTVLSGAPSWGWNLHPPSLGGMGFQGCAITRKPLWQRKGHLHWV